METNNQSHLYLITGLILGAALGLLISLVIAPVVHQVALPQELSPQAKAEYRLDIARLSGRAKPGTRAQPAGAAERSRPLRGAHRASPGTAGQRRLGGRSPRAGLPGWLAAERAAQPHHTSLNASLQSKKLTKRQLFGVCA